MAAPSWNPLGAQRATPRPGPARASSTSRSRRALGAAYFFMVWQCMQPSAAGSGFFGSKFLRPSRAAICGFTVSPMNFIALGFFFMSSANPSWVVGSTGSSGLGILNSRALASLPWQVEHLKSLNWSASNAAKTGFIFGMTTAFMNLPFCSLVMSFQATSGGPTTFPAGAAPAGAAAAGAGGGGGGARPAGGRQAPGGGAPGGGREGGGGRV